MKTPIKNALLLAAIFAAGVVTGSVNSIGVGQRLAEQRLSVDRFHSTLMGILKSELDLTTDQLLRVEPIVRQACEQYRALMLETAQRVTGLVQGANARIARELTPAQAERLKQLEAERERLARQKLSTESLEKGFLGD